MTIGEKIKRVRKFRKMTQAELGTAVGLGENAQNRIAHYERGTRVPQKELLDRMAEVLDVNRYMLYDSSGCSSFRGSPARSAMRATIQACTTTTRTNGLPVRRWRCGSTAA